MKRNVVLKRIATLMLSSALALTSVVVPQTDVNAASAKTVKSITLKTGNTKVTKKTVTLEKGKKLTVKVTVKPSSAKKAIAFQSSKKKVAKVNKKGVVVAKSVGTAKIKVTVTGKDKKKKTTYVNVKVVNPGQVPTNTNPTPDNTTKPDNTTTPDNTTKPDNTTTPDNTTKPDNTTPDNTKPDNTTKPDDNTTNPGGNTTNPGGNTNDPYGPEGTQVTSVSVTMKPYALLKVNESAHIEATVLPDNASNKTLTYSSDNTQVAVVDETGAVTGMNEGTATIRATAANGVYGEVKVTVTKSDIAPVTAIKLDKAEVAVTISRTATIIATVEPGNATNGTLSWTSENPAIATIDSKGVVTGVSEGTTKVTATANDGSGCTASCVVTVTKNSIIADGIVAEVTNPYKDNKGKEYENTVLVGDDMSIRVRSMKGGQGNGKAQIKLELEEQYGTGAEYFEVRQKQVTADDDGYAEFTVGLKSDYVGKINAVSDVYQSFTAIATDSAANQTAEITIKFARININGIQVDNNRYEGIPDILPSDNVSAKDNGIYATDSLNGKKIEEYVTSQQVSSENIDHKVYLSAEPELILPATKGSEHLGKWEKVFPIGEEDGISGAYSIYNTADNKTTTTVVEEVPAGLQYVTLNFDKVNLSRYTAMYVHLYNAAGMVIGEEVRTHLNNETQNSIQIQKKTEDSSKLVISLVSQGQVDVSSDGYILTSIEGEWAATNNELTTSIPLEDTVTWEDISATYGKKYDVKAWTYDEAAQYLDPDKAKAFLNPKFVYSYKVPAFPHTGNAIITVKDANENVKGYFLYPTINDFDMVTNKNGELEPDYKNVNVLAPLKTGIYAVQASQDEVTVVDKGTLTTNGNQAIVDAKLCGTTALKATVKVNGLSESELNSQNGGELYTSVHWAPLQGVDEEELVPEFYALEGQQVVVTAKLYDQNGNEKAESGKNIKFTYGDLEDPTEITEVHQVINDVNEDSDNAVTVTKFENATDVTGCARLTLTGTGMGYLKNLTATAEGYKVGLSFKTTDTPNVELTKGSIYWVDLGVTFVDSAVDTDAPVRTTQFKNDKKTIEKNSTSVVEKKWKIGYLPVAQSYKFKYSNPDVVERERENNEFYSIDNIALTYTKNGPGSLESGNNEAIIQSTETGDTVITGGIDAANINSEAVVFNFYNENGKVVSYNNVGVGAVTVTSALELTMKWTHKGMNLEFITPTGTTAAIGRDLTIYAHVKDDLGNSMPDANISYKYHGSNRGDDSIDGKTDDNGLYKIEFPAAQNVEDITVTVTVENSVTQTLLLHFIESKDAKPNEIAENGVQKVGENQLKVSFVNELRAETLIPDLFEFVQDDSKDTTYKVMKAEMSTDNNAVILTLDKNIVNTTVNHTLKVKTYTDKRGVKYELIDAFGQNIHTEDSYTFVPATGDPYTPGTSQDPYGPSASDPYGPTAK